MNFQSEIPGEPGQEVQGDDERQAAPDDGRDHPAGGHQRGRHGRRFAGKNVEK